MGRITEFNFPATSRFQNAIRSSPNWARAGRAKSIRSGKRPREFTGRPSFFCPIVTCITNRQSTMPKNSTDCEIVPFSFSTSPKILLSIGITRSPISSVTLWRGSPWISSFSGSRGSECRHFRAAFSPRHLHRGGRHSRPKGLPRGPTYRKRHRQTLWP